MDLETDDGRLVGVVVHQTGRRDLVIYDEQDRDRAGESVELSEDEGHTLGELLGGSRVVERLDDAAIVNSARGVTIIPLQKTNASRGRKWLELLLKK